MANPGKLYEWVEALPEGGRYVFSRTEVEDLTNTSDTAIKMTLFRLKRSGAIINPRRDFYVVVPREYRSAGSPPASWFIDDLMRHLGRRYYVALLSASALHGAGHQQPMAFQVIVDAAERDMVVGRVRIEFHRSNRIKGAATERIRTETGSMVASTPETTAFDIVRFPAACGFWSNIATILSELAEKIDADKLAAGAVRVARSDVQRLGWLLDFIGESELADALTGILEGERLQPTPLSTKRTSDKAVLDPRWRILVNDDVEPDL